MVYKYITLILFTLSLTSCSIDFTTGSSMFPNVTHNSMVMCSYYYGELKRNDIIIIDVGAEMFYIKRIIGLPGENIKMHNRHVFINGKLLYEPLIVLRLSKGTIDVQLKDNEYYVLGDNRSDSHDSRDFGPITKDQIIGKIICIWKGK